MLTVMLLLLLLLLMVLGSCGYASCRHNLTFDEAYLLVKTDLVTRKPVGFYDPPFPYWCNYGEENEFISLLNPIIVDATEKAVSDYAAEYNVFLFVQESYPPRFHLAAGGD
jgi:hypothetical protein